MPMLRRIAPLTAAAVLGALTLLPAATASAATTVIPRPADCTETRIDTRTISLTCTSRPASQQWQTWIVCGGGWFDTQADGNVVTGNGTSTAVCPAGSMAYNGAFFRLL
jgi:hypothetical protein